MASAKDIKEARQRVLGSIKTAMTGLKNRVISTMVQEHMSGPTGPTSVSVRSGQLRRSLNGIVTTWGGGKTIALTMYFGGGTPYAAIHEYGGVVTPKRAKNLAIPVGAAKTKAGVSRNSGPMAIWASLKFIINKKTGKKLLVQQGRGKMQVMFVLVPMVTIPPRLNFGKTFKAEAEKTLQQINQIKVIGFGGRS